MPVFDSYTLTDAKAIVSGRLSTAASTNLAFYNGDHWQGANGWTGPSPKASDVGYAATMDEIKRAFVSRNAISEIVDRHVAGVLGRELHWGFSLKHPMNKKEVEDPQTGQKRVEPEQPTDEEQALITEAEQALTAWWDRHQTPNKLQDMARAALLAKRAVLRLYVPPGMRNEDGLVPEGDLATSLDRIWLQHLGTNEDTLDLQLPTATVYTDKLTKRDVGLFTYNTASEKPGGAEGVELAELCYLDDSGQTVLRIIDGNGNVEGEEPVTLPLDGRLTLYEMVRRPIAGEQVISQQKLLNLSETMKQRNVILGGFLERVWLNAQIPGTTVKGADGNDVFVPNPVYTGAASMNVLQGIKYKDAQGNEQITQPSVVYRDPVPVTTFSETSSSAYLAILEEAHQLHYALAGDAAVSGESRIQARDAFQKDLFISAVQVEAAARWLLETVLAMAAHFSGQPGRFSGLRAVVQARIDSGPISSEEKQATIQLKDAGLRSTETAMSETGVEDTGAEIERIERERTEQQEQGAILLSETERAKIYQAYRAASVPPAPAAKRAGWTEEQIAELEKSIIEQAEKEEDSATNDMEERLRKATNTQAASQPVQLSGAQPR